MNPNQNNEPLWLPIEQAVKDGRWYEVKHHYDTGSFNARWNRNGWEDSEGCSTNPTHFRLPVGEGKELEGDVWFEAALQKLLDMPDDEFKQKMVEVGAQFSAPTPAENAAAAVAREIASHMTEWSALSIQERTDHLTAILTRHQREGEEGLGVNWEQQATEVYRELSDLRSLIHSSVMLDGCATAADKVRHMASALASRDAALAELALERAKNAEAEEFTAVRADIVRISKERDAALAEVEGLREESTKIRDYLIEAMGAEVCEGNDNPQMVAILASQRDNAQNEAEHYLQELAVKKFQVTALRADVERLRSQLHDAQE